MPAFSIIVPAYNMQDYLDEALASVAAQTLTDFEAIIVDDGSTDNTAAIAKRFCAHDWRFRYLHQPNQGLSASRNLGTRAARGEFICYLDSDDYLERDTLQACHDAFRRDHVDVVLFEAELFPADSPLYEIERFHFQRPSVDSPLASDDFVKHALQQNRYNVTAYCMAIRRSAMAELRFIDGMLYEDNHFFLSLLLETRRQVAVMHRQFYKRRLRSDSIMFMKKTPQHYTSLYRLLREISMLSFRALDPPDRAAVKKQIIGRTLGDLYFVSSLVGHQLWLRKMNVAAAWYVALHVSPRLLVPKRIVLGLVPELYRLKAQARLQR